MRRLGISPFNPILSIFRICIIFFRLLPFSIDIRLALLSLSGQTYSTKPYQGDFLIGQYH